MKIRESRNKEKARKDLFSSESAASTVIAAVLLLSIIFTLFAVVRIAYVPEWKNDAEELHMKEVLDDMGNLRSAIDTATFFKSSPASSPSTTVQIQMGGGEVPIGEPSRSSGILSVNMDPCSANLTLHNISGEVIYSDDFPCGGVTYSSNNRQFVDQTMRYENGALILEQGDKSVMRQDPPFTINNTKIDTENDTYNFSVSINLINISGNRDSTSSDTVESLRLTATDFKQERGDDSEPVDTFEYTVFTKYPDAWTFYFNETAKGAGLIYGSDFNITNSLSDGSKGLYSVSFDFRHTDDKYLDHLYVNKSVVDIKQGNTVSSSFTTITSIRQPPTAGFSFTPSSGFAPLKIKINDESQNAKNYSYDFNDGSDPMTVAEPNYTFNTPGTYKITQKVTNRHGTTNITKSITIRHMPIASFTCDVAGGDVPFDVKFVDRSQFATGGLTWNFGDETSSTEQNPTHTYDKPGNYTVTLTASNGVETNNMTREIIATQLPVAIFDAYPASGPAPLTVTFSSDNSENVDTWNWNFGDGSTISHDENPMHTYTKVDDYNVILTATNMYGPSVTSMVVSVFDPIPVPNFKMAPTLGVHPLKVAFTDMSTNRPTLWSWNFGDETSSTEQNPSHTFQTAKKYYVTLTAKNLAGSSTITKSITVT